MNQELVRVKLVWEKAPLTGPPGTGMGFYEENANHPGGVVNLYGRNVVEAALTRKVAFYLGAGRLNAPLSKAQQQEVDRLNATPWKGEREGGD